MNRVTLHDYKALLGLEVYLVDLRKSAVVILDTCGRTTVSAPPPAVTLAASFKGDVCPGPAPFLASTGPDNSTGFFGSAASWDPKASNSSTGFFGSAGFLGSKGVN